MSANIRTEIGDRLGNERRRLGLSQDELAQLGDVAKRTQAAWEKGEQVPHAEYLAHVANHGVDVLFVVTGSRQSGGAASELLSEGETDLLKSYRLIEPGPLKRALTDIAARLAKPVVDLEERVDGV